MVPSRWASTHPGAPSTYSSAPDAGFVKGDGAHADSFLKGKSGNGTEGPVLPHVLPTHSEGSLSTPSPADTSMLMGSMVAGRSTQELGLIYAQRKTNLSY